MTPVSYLLVFCVCVARAQRKKQFMPPRLNPMNTFSEEVAMELDETRKFMTHYPHRSFWKNEEGDDEKILKSFFVLFFALLFVLHLGETAPPDLLPSFVLSSPHTARCVSKCFPKRGDGRGAGPGLRRRHPQGVRIEAGAPRGQCELRGRRCWALTDWGRVQWKWGDQICVL